MDCDNECGLFGAYRVVISIKDSVILIHSTVGCNWGTLAFHISSKINDIRQTSTVIYEEEIINGGEKILEEALKNAVKLYKAKIIYVITGCIPEIINDDAEKVISRFKQKNNLKNIFLLKEPGFSDEGVKGSKNAFKLLIDEMIQKKIIENSVNLIGFFSDDYKIDSDLVNIENMLKDSVYINSIFPYDCYQNIMKIPSASLNVVLYGFEFVGEMLKQKFGTPYIIVSYPYGVAGSRIFVNKILGSLHIEVSGNFCGKEISSLELLNRFRPFADDFKGMPVAVLGDKARIYGLKNFLEIELGMFVDVLIDTEQKRDREIIRDEVIRSNSIMIFGSSFDRELANELDIPFLQYTYPVFDKFSISKSGYAGLEGAIFLLEDILNLVYFYKLISKC
ncbi:MAG: nitrogenase component 1 [Clostridium luticellarii]|uniref:nitrogenase component 1 n=1 Tax=Clostridium luticellarii TaxID=1691940 RepID=UPI002355E7C1|nr:nitrogenase component 1 [Clostridium luticellarii]MCI2040437.1 nitrogenase component 1 [Clostridium luticellarii]